MDFIAAFAKAVAAPQAIRRVTLVTSSLSKAAGNDPTSRQYIEGVFRDNYFPQFYLSVAYANKGELDKAKLFYGVRGSVPGSVSKHFTPTVQEIRK